MSKTTIKGLDDVLLKLKNFEDMQQNKFLRAGVSRGIGVIRRNAIKNAKEFDNPDTPNTVYKNVVSRMYKVKKGKKYLGAKVGVVKGNGKGGDTYYWYFLEFGTKKMAAKRFLTRALEEDNQKVYDAVVLGATKAIDKIAKG